jgi:hypothetical protein
VQRDDEDGDGGGGGGGGGGCGDDDGGDDDDESVFFFPRVLRNQPRRVPGQMGQTASQAEGQRFTKRIYQEDDSFWLI